VVLTNGLAKNYGAKRDGGCLGFGVRKFTYLRKSIRGLPEEEEKRAAEKKLRGARPALINDNAKS